MYNLKNDQSIVIKEADKDSAVVYGKKGLLMEAEKHLFCKETYEEVSSDPSLLIKTSKKGDISSNILDYFNVVKKP